VAARLRPQEAGEGGERDEALLRARLERGPAASMLFRPEEVHPRSEKRRPASRGAEPIVEVADHPGWVAHSKGDGRAPRSDTGAVERFLRRSVCRSDHRLGFRSPAARATHLQGAPVALAYMAELRSQLRFHRNCLG